MTDTPRPTGGEKPDWESVAKDYEVEIQDLHAEREELQAEITRLRELQRGGEAKEGEPRLCPDTVCPLCYHEYDACSHCGPEETSPVPREGGHWISSNALSEYLIAHARTRCDGWDWHVNPDGLGWAFVPDDHLRAVLNPRGATHEAGEEADPPIETRALSPDAESDGQGSTAAQPEEERPADGVGRDGGGVGAGSSDKVNRPPVVTRPKGWWWECLNPECADDRLESVGPPASCRSCGSSVRYWPVDVVEASPVGEVDYGRLFFCRLPDGLLMELGATWRRDHKNLGAFRESARGTAEFYGGELVEARVLIPTPTGPETPEDG